MVIRAWLIQWYEHTRSLEYIACLRNRHGLLWVIPMLTSRTPGWRSKTPILQDAGRVGLQGDRDLISLGFADGLRLHPSPRRDTRICSGRCLAAGALPLPR